MTNSLKFKEQYEKYTKNVNCVDKNDELKMFCVTNIDEKSTDIEKNCRGIVIDSEDNIILRTFPYTNEYTEKSDFSFINNITDWNFQNSYEGCLIRVFYYNNKWYLATHRKLDCFNSKWSCRDSFGILFLEALNKLNHPKFNGKFLYPNENISLDDLKTRFTNLLDTNVQYVFLLLNNEYNRIVCNDWKETESVYHVGTFIKGEQIFDDGYIGIPKPKGMVFNELDEMKCYVSDININQKQGIFGFNKKTKQVIKIYNSDYLELFNVRGNVSSLKFRYLEIRNDLDMVDKFLYLYPKMKDHINLYEQAIQDITSYIYKSYVNRFINKQYVTLPKEEYKILYKCHSWHISSRNQNKIYYNKVLEIVTNEPPSILNRLINNYINHKKRTIHIGNTNDIY